MKKLVLPLLAFTTLPLAACVPARNSFDPTSTADFIANNLFSADKRTLL